MTQKMQTLTLAPSRRKYIPFLLAALAFLLYANTIGNGYNMDDELVTRKHKLTSKGISAIPDIFTTPYYKDAMGYSYGYRPLSQVSFALENQFFGEKPGVSHFFNVLLYAVCVLLFFRLLIRWTGEKGLPLAVTATLLFAVHPIHAEVVASIKNRDEILSLLFGLLAGLSFEKAVRRLGFVPVFLSALYLTLSLFSKKSTYPLVIIFPLVALILERPPLKRLLIASSGLWITGAVVVSEFRPDRMLLLLLAPIGLILAVWYVSQKMQRDKLQAWLFRWTGDYRILTALALVCLAWGVFRHEGIWLLVSLVLGIVSAYRKPEWAAYFAVVFCLAAGRYEPTSELTMLAVFIASYGLVRTFINDRKSALGMLPFWVLASAVFILVDFNWHKINLLLILLPLFFFIHKKPKWALPFLAVGVLGFSLAGGAFTRIYLLLLLFGLKELLDLFKPLAMVDRFWPFGMIVLLLVLFAVNRSVNRPEPAAAPVHTETVLPPLKPAERDSRFREGRNLEFAENSLVAPHSQTQTIGTGAVTLGEYLRLMVFPYELSFYYGYARLNTTDLSNPWVWVSLSLYLALFVLAVWQVKKRPFLSIGILWYLFSIGLFSNWVELVAGMLGERLAFTASAGFCLALAAALLWLKPGLTPKKIAAPEVALGLVLLLFGVRTLLRNTDWKDAVTLMGTDITHLENSAQANNLYALNLMQASFETKKYNPQQQFNMRKLAVTHFDRALQIWPGFFNAAYDKGRSAQMIGDIPAAIDGFEKAAAMKHADFMDPNYQLSDLYLKTGRYPDFLKNAKAIFEVEHARPEAYNLVARGFFLNSRTDSAKIYLRKGLQLYPADAGLKNNMAEIFKMEGRPDSADYYLLK